MNGDLLLEWMAHTGSGQWGGFRAAVEALAGPDPVDPHALARRLRISLSDSGHADFFLGGTSRWRARRPVLAGLSGSNECLLVGARPRTLLNEATTAAKKCGAAVEESRCVDVPTQLRIIGGAAILEDIGALVSTPFISEAGIRLALQCVPMAHVIQSSKEAEEPINWNVHSWSFEERRWTTGRQDRTARQYENRHGVRRYFLASGRGRLLEMERRHAVYAAALVSSRPLAHYHSIEERMFVPVHAPLPVEYARALCLSRGVPAVLDRDRLVFQRVDPRIANIVLTKLGQRYEPGGGL
jgi:hypothetical protein